MADAFLREDLKSDLSEGRMIEQAWAMEGEVVREVADRQTLRVEIGGRTFYLKRHRGAGWLEREPFRRYVPEPELHAG